MGKGLPNRLDKVNATDTASFVIHAQGMKFFLGRGGILSGMLQDFLFRDRVVEGEEHVADIKDDCVDLHEDRENRPGACFLCNRFCFPPHSIHLSNGLVKKILILLLIALLVGGWFFFQGEGFQRLWHRCLVVAVPMEKADALIVLGGEPLARPLEAARLYRNGVAPRVFVTGLGDAVRNRQVLMAGGVPSSAITMESKAVSTYMNAVLLKPMLEAAGVRTALIITSPFHTRRALATFRKILPGITFGVTEASIGWWKTKEGRGDINRFATVEFLKTIEYWLLYGISPFYRVGSF